MIFWLAATRPCLRRIRPIPLFSGSAGRVSTPTAPTCATQAIEQVERPPPSAGPVALDLVAELTLVDAVGLPLASRPLQPHLGAAPCRPRRNSQPNACSADERDRLVRSAGRATAHPAGSVNRSSCQNSQGPSRKALGSALGTARHVTSRLGARDTRAPKAPSPAPPGQSRSRGRGIRRSCARASSSISRATHGTSDCIADCSEPRLTIASSLSYRWPTKKPARDHVEIVVAAPGRGHQQRGGRVGTLLEDEYPARRPCDRTGR